MHCYLFPQDAASGKTTGSVSSGSGDKEKVALWIKENGSWLGWGWVGGWFVILLFGFVVQRPNFCLFVQVPALCLIIQL